ncbi:hypothetical protein [Paraurantiacibacter namhicola]|uniref:Uncharacterized protein n=1 Tax=Paraurantiacibacter namhicola TaxID=645517 RepID=A0A1C7D946_9SPHN|nr:hypothetical protein [Paraurantiacibacter namhicola]ANU07823.1 hypothetical protein A6F65_01520 [Paraurantiacibacter namhicola]
MEEVFIPFVLVLMAWQADDPQGSMQVSQSVFLDEDTCLRAGREREALVEQSGSEGWQFAWKCAPQPRTITKYRPLKSAE